MNTSGIRFGDIGVIYGPREKAEKLLGWISRYEEEGVYFAENWSQSAKSGDTPLFAYVTGEHQQSLGGEQPDFDTLFEQFSQEFRTGTSGRGYLNEDIEVSNAQSGKGVARLHRISYDA